MLAACCLSSAWAQSSAVVLFTNPDVATPTPAVNVANPDNALVPDGAFATMTSLGTFLRLDYSLSFTAGTPVRITAISIRVGHNIQLNVRLCPVLRRLSHTFSTGTLASDYH